MMQGRSQTSSEPRTDEWAEPLSDSQPGITLERIQQALRGRYHLVVILGLICAIVGATIGLESGGPKYTSTALVHVAPALPRVLFANEQNKPLPNFESFIKGQATLLMSRGNMEEALKDPAMLDAGWPSGSRGEQRLIAETIVTRNRSEEFISVSVTDRVPARAQAATNALVDAYIQPQRERAGLKQRTTEQALQERQETLELNVSDLQERIVDAASGFGGPDLLERLYSAKIHQLEQIETKLSSSTPAYASDRVLTILEQEEMYLLLRINDLDPGFGPNHCESKSVSHRLHSVRKLIRERQNMLAQRSGWDDRVISINQDEGGLQGSQSIPSDVQKNTRQSLVDEVIEIGHARHLISSLQEQLDAKNEQLAETRYRLEEFDVEAIQVGGTRISIAARGHLPSVPSKDRRAVAAIFGALFGAMCGVGVICLIGLLDHRCRFIADVEMLDSEIQLLGSIPDQNMCGPKQIARCSVAVHELRNALQIARGNEESCTYCFTSPDVGDGKTSLTLALGASFALAGQRTLVIDADLQHSDMTRGLDLVDSIGLGEALKGHSLPECIHSTTTPGLSVMPTGNAEGFVPERLSGESLDRLLKQMRLTFDTVLVDTTPLLGGLEASLISVLCDRVVLVLSRNMDVRHANAALRRLEQLGARCAGMAFNRSLPGDYIHSLNANVKGVHSTRSPIIQIGDAVTVNALNEQNSAASMERAA